MYKLFENKVKPSMTWGKKEYNITDTKAETSTKSYSKDFQVCGDLKMSYATSHGVDTSTITSDNPNGVYVNQILTFSRWPMAASRP